MMLDPTALPTLKPPLPRSAAISDTENSGIEVPNPTTVRPTTNVETPSRSASREAPSTSQDAPLASMTMPPATISQGTSQLTVGMLTPQFTA